MKQELKQEIACLKSDLRDRRWRREHAQCNDKFELSRKAFYRGLGNLKRIDDSKVESAKVKEFWTGVYKKKDVNPAEYEDILHIA